MTLEEIEHPALSGASWPVIGVRVRREEGLVRAASWRPAARAVLEDVLLPCTWPELEGLARIAAGVSRARVYVCGVGGAEPGGRMVLCLRGAAGAVRVEGPLAAAVGVLAGRTRAAALRVAAVHREAGRREEAQVWRALARRMLRDGRSARRGRSVRAASAGLPTLGGRS